MSSLRRFDDFTFLIIFVIFFTSCYWYL